MKIFCNGDCNEELINQLRVDNEQLRRERDRYIDLLMESKQVTLPNILPGDRSEIETNAKPLRRMNRAQVIQQLEEEGRKKALKQFEQMKEGK